MKARIRVRDSSGNPGAPSSARGLAADSPTALHLNAGTPKQTARMTIDLLFNSLEFEGIGTPPVATVSISR